MATEIVQRQETALKTVGTITTAEDILTSDLVIPKVLLMQGLSEFVSQRQAQSGDIVRSMSADKLGDDEVPVSIIPITFRNMWLNQEKVDGKFEYRGMEGRDASNENAEWDYKIGNVQWGRTKVLELFCLLTNDLVADAARSSSEDDDFAPNLNNVVMPHVISFRSTMFKTGKQFVSHFNSAKMAGVEPFRYKIDLKCESTKNDKGTFFVWSMGKTTPCEKPHYVIAKKWHGIIAGKAKKFTVDDSDETRTGDEQHIETIDTTIETSEY